MGWDKTLSLPTPFPLLDSPSGLPLHPLHPLYLSLSEMPGPAPSYSTYYGC